MPGSNCKVRQRYFTVLSLATLRLCLKQRTLSRHPSGSNGRNFRVLRHDSEASVEADEEVLQHDVLLDGCCASLSSVTNLSWSVPAVRSTLPLACGDRAKTICIPLAIARLNCVGARASPDPGTFLKGVPVGVEGNGYAVAL